LATRLLLVAPFVLVFCITGLNFRLIGDESFFHLAVIQHFANSLPFPDISNYNTASGPLPYLAWAIEGKIIGFDTWKLRLVSLIASCISVNLFYDICKRHTLPFPLITTLFLLFCPYFFLYSFTIYTISIAMLFGIWSLWFFLLEETTVPDLLKGGLLATLALFSRQFYLALPLGMILYEFVQKLAGRLQDLVVVVRKNLWRWLLVGLPVLLILPLFILWGGLTPAHQKEWIIGQPYPQQLNYFPMIVAVYFLPALINTKILRLLKLWKFVLPVLLFLLAIYFYFPLPYSDAMAKATASGVIVNGVDIIAKVAGNLPAQIVEFTLWFIGVLIILTEVFDFPYDKFKTKLLIFCAAFLILLLFVPYFWERFYISIIPYVILLLLRSNRRRLLLILYLGVNVVIAVGYSYWQIVLKVR
jgi:Dolichyl-phosphate-mannose-protein mannosyltransferase